MSAMGDVFTRKIPVRHMVVRGTAVYWFLLLVFRFVLRRDIGSMSGADTAVRGAGGRRIEQCDAGRIPIGERRIGAADHIGRLELRTLACRRSRDSWNRNQRC